MFCDHSCIDSIMFLFLKKYYNTICLMGARGSAVVKAVFYKLEGHVVSIPYDVSLKGCVV
jgi:hypothetical protein